MKKIISLLVASVLLLCGCTTSAQPNQTPPTSQTDETSVPVHPELNTVFTWNEEGIWSANPAMNMYAYRTKERIPCDISEFPSLQVRFRVNRKQITY